LLHLQNSLLTRKFYFSQRRFAGGITSGTPRSRNVQQVSRVFRLHRVRWLLPRVALLCAHVDRIF
ncbi:hypothetical protein, partial [Pandoraea cepalis]|uniref:hypothetical protein n=1 Tax=Pandoraea cepalis TaxID=2508294 RepID=UPI001C2D88B6